MSIVVVEFKQGNGDNDEYIEQLWAIMCFARNFNDNPLVWKLTDPFLNSIGKFWNISSRETLLQLKFLDTSLDVTSLKPILICEKSIYPVDLNNLK
jgi:hypothetical protein